VPTRLILEAAKAGINFGNDLGGLGGSGERKRGGAMRDGCPQISAQAGITLIQTVGALRWLGSFMMGMQDVGGGRHCLRPDGNDRNKCDYGQQQFHG